MSDDVVQVRLPKAKPLQVGEKFFKSAYDWELSEENLQRAALELGEEEEKKKVCLQKLKEKLSNDSNVKYRQDDLYLLRFLRVRKYDVQKAYQNMKQFFEQRNKHSDLFTLSSEKITTVMNIQKKNVLTFLPYADEEERIFLLLNFERWNPEEISFENLMPSFSNVADLCVMNPKCQINGIVAIADFKGISRKHISELLSKNRLWLYISFSVNGYPWRLKKFIILNANGLARFLFGIAKPFLPRKIVERTLLIGSDMSELHKHINPVLLPKILEGSLEEDDCDTSQHVLENLPYLRYERTFVRKK